MAVWRVLNNRPAFITRSGFIFLYIIFNGFSVSFIVAEGFAFFL